MPKKLKVCFVTEDFYPEFIGGQGIYGFHLVSELSKRGVEMTVIAENRKGRRSFWLDRNINLLFVPFVFGNQLLLAVVEYLYFLWKLRHGAFDIVHANQLSGLLFVLFRPKNVGAIVLSVHNTYFDMSQAADSKFKRLVYKPLVWLEKIMFQRADALLFNSPDEKVQLTRYCQINNIKTAVVYLGVRKISYSKKEKNQSRRYLRQKLKLEKEEKIILYVGRLVTRKKVDTLLKAIDALNKENIRVAGIIVGQGKDRERLERISPQNVFFQGFIDNPRPYFLGSDLFATVSVAEGGILLSALEAASFGLPLVLSPDAGSIPILKQGINGYFADPDDPRDVAAKIRRVLQSPHLGRESRKLSRFFSWKKCAKETLTFYRSLVQRSLRST